MEKIAFIFPGQGSQYVGMFKKLCEDFPIAEQTFEEANDVLGFDLKNLCFEGSLGKLSQTKNALVALLVSSVAAFRVYTKEIGVAPQFCAGHSLGEYSALTCSGVIRFPDAVRIAYNRALLAEKIADAGDVGMTIIDGIGGEAIEEECKKISREGNIVAVSCYNSSKQAAVSGHLDAIQKIEDRVLEMGGQVTPLIGSAPFHSELMLPAAEALREELKKYSYSPPRYPVISNVTGRPYAGREKVIDMLAGQMTKPVRWKETIEYFKKLGVTLTVEMGPKNVLSNLVKTDIESISTMAFDQKEDRGNLIDFFSNNQEYSKHVPTVVTRCLAVAVATPNSNWNEEEYRQGVVIPYGKIRQIQEELEKQGNTPNVEQMKETLEMLRLIFDTKKLPVEEQREWFRQIFDETGTQYLLSDFRMP